MTMFTAWIYVWMEMLAAKKANKQMIKTNTRSSMPRRMIGAMVGAINRYQSIAWLVQSIGTAIARLLCQLNLASERYVLKIIMGLNPRLKGGGAILCHPPFFLRYLPVRYGSSPNFQYPPNHPYYTAWQKENSLSLIRQP